MGKTLLTGLIFMLAAFNVGAEEKAKTEQCQMQINTKELGAIAQNFIRAFANSNSVKAQEEQAAAKKKIEEANLKHEQCLQKAGYSTAKAKTTRK